MQNPKLIVSDDDAVACRNAHTGAAKTGFDFPSFSTARELRSCQLLEAFDLLVLGSTLRRTDGVAVSNFQGQRQLCPPTLPGGSFEARGTSRAMSNLSHNSGMSAVAESFEERVAMPILNGEQYHPAKDRGLDMPIGAGSSLGRFGGLATPGQAS